LATFGKYLFNEVILKNVFARGTPGYCKYPLWFPVGNHWAREWLGKKQHAARQ